MKTCLTIAGSDCSGGAGIQADLKTFAAQGVYGMSAITALTAQNTIGVHAVSLIDTDFIEKQIDVIFDDIRPDAVKIGMLANAEIINTVATRLDHHKADNVVLDPVMIATSGDPLLDGTAIKNLLDELIPQARIITPNAPELVALCRTQGIDVDLERNMDQEYLEILTDALFQSLPAKTNGRKIAVLSKGGHLDVDQACDLLVSDNGKTWFREKRIKTNNTHGTGCTLSAAICAQLALGESIENACANAKNYLTNALKKGLDLGSGNGPLNHLNAY